MFTKTLQLISSVALVCAIGSANAWDPWNRTSTILSRISAPTFPTATTNVAASTNSRYNIQLAINNRSTAGGGKVVLNETGVYLSKGPIHLKNNVNLVINSGATLRFEMAAVGTGNTKENYLGSTTEPGAAPSGGGWLTAWEGFWCYKRSPLIYAYQQTNIAVTGSGYIDGNGDAGWYDWNAIDNPDQDTLYAWGGEPGRIKPLNQRLFGDANRLRCDLVQPILCKNVLLDGFHTKGSAWHQIHPTKCQNVTITDLDVFGGTWVNSDGINPNGCKNVLVERCHIENGDDGFTPKAGRDEDGWVTGVMGQGMDEDIIIRNSWVKGTTGAAGGLSMGSPTSGGVRNVYFDYDTIYGRSRPVYIKTLACRGGYISGIHYRNIMLIGSPGSNAIEFNTIYKPCRDQCSDSIYPPDVHDITVTNFRSTVTVPAKAVCIRGDHLRNKQIMNLKFTNVDFSSKGATGGAMDTSFCKNLVFTNFDVGATDYSFTSGTIVPVSGVTLNATTKTLTVNGTFDLNETVSPTNASNKVVMFESSNENVVSVNFTGMAKGVAVGTATVTALCQDDNTKTAVCTFTVQSTVVPPSYTKEGESLGFTKNPTTVGNTVASATASSAGKHQRLDATATGQSIQFTLLNVPAYTYSVRVYYPKGTSYGTVQVSVNGTNLGSVIDQYSATTMYYQYTTIGTRAFNEGTNYIKFTVAGKNASSSDYKIALDKVLLTPQ